MFLLLLVFLGIWSIPLFLITLSGDDTVIVVGALTITLLIFATIPLALDRIGKWIMRFPGTGSPIPMDKLVHILTAVNHQNTAVRVEHKKPNHLIVTWNYVDAKWWGVLSKQGKRSIYQLHIKLNKKKHRATLIDVMKKINWSARPDGVKVSGGFFRGIALETEFGKAWSINQAWRFEKAYDYTFKNTEIKYPILHTLRENGWDVRMGMW